MSNFAVSPITVLWVTPILPGVSALLSELMSSVLHKLTRCAGTWTKQSWDEGTECQSDHQLTGALSSAFPWLLSFIIVAKLRKRAGLDGACFLVRF